MGKKDSVQKKRNSNEEEWELKCGWMDGRDDERAAVTGKRGWFIESRGSHAKCPCEAISIKMILIRKLQTNKATASNLLPQK